MCKKGFDITIKVADVRVYRNGSVFHEKHFKCHEFCMYLISQN